ncbi:Arylsulfatase [Thalassoglobus neptunius]|uniref:Arylsulfatase n=1 Tax=Thalassoglobus neptunius TaxID=1938619 RepID=A0A5C5VPK4_9PLAN|nr:sulfatase [Thalassoglobus neptunius]TWT39865.1 Arylsulfatase [Thalassoglobus neptunius]
MMRLPTYFVVIIAALFFAIFVLNETVNAQALANERPNILWIYVDDMSDWLGCNGDSLAQTPNIDRLASSGILFKNAFMPSPVCSTTRSALITGTMQTTLGLHQHRTMIKQPLPEDVMTIPELFREAGYITFNEAKDDYNFSRPREKMYSPEFERPGFKSHLPASDLTWLAQLRDQRFFGQIQLAGGKLGGETGSKFPSPSRVLEEDVTVPPQYPDNQVFRNAIARHYEQIAYTDEQVGTIIEALKKYELWESTIVLFFTDHGSPLPRSKQFLYEEGTKVPLIVRIPERFALASSQPAVRMDLVSGIDISTTTLALAGIGIPKFMEGHDLFSSSQLPRQFVISARDRCGIAVDRIRSVRTDRFRYIANELNDRPLYQSQYRDRFSTIVNLRTLFESGEITPLQASYHEAANRPAEELYDVIADPDQIHDLAADPDYRTILETHRSFLRDWRESSEDQGLIPESRASLQLVYDHARGRCPAPEFDIFRKEDSHSTRD